MARMPGPVAALRRYATPLALAVALAAIVLGPAIGPGLILAYDLGWSPDPRLTPFVTGTGTVAPRAVPSDTVVVLLGLALGAPAAQSVVLLTVVVLAGLGPLVLVRHLRPGIGGLAQAAAVVAGMWNPFVAERLAIGQWTIVLGYGLTGFGVRSVLLWRAGRTSLAGVCGWLVAAAIGGANTLVMVVWPMVLLVLWPRRWSPGPSGARRWRAVLGVAVVAGALAAVWALPAVVAGVRGDPAGGRAFAARADTPFGLVVSLVSGGGMWNRAAHPAPRAALVSAAAATIAAMAMLAVAAASLRRADPSRRQVIAVAAVGGLGLLATAASGLRPFGAAWSRVLTLVPGGAVLRDSQKLLAVWVVVLALAWALAVETLWRHVAHDIAPVLAVVAALAPLALLPTLAWGAGGRWHPITVPADYRAAAAALSAREPGLVAVLPWQQYRRYPWNDERVALSLAPRIVDQQVLHSDDPLTWAGWVRGEDPRAALVRIAVDEGANPVAAVRRAGARYVFFELDSAVPLPDRVDGTVVHRSANALVVDLGEPVVQPPPGPARWPVRVGWAVTLVTAAGVLVGRGFHRRFSAGVKPPRLLPFGT